MDTNTQLTFVILYWSNKYSKPPILIGSCNSVSEILPKINIYFKSTTNLVNIESNTSCICNTGTQKYKVTVIYKDNSKEIFNVIVFRLWD